MSIPTMDRPLPADPQPVSHDLTLDLHREELDPHFVYTPQSQS